VWTEDGCIIGWRKLHEEFHNLCVLLNVTRMIKSGLMRMTCSMHRRKEHCVQGFYGNARSKETTRKT
jgi:hypothetical protein